MSERIYRPSTEEISAAKNLHGKVWLVLADPEDSDGHACIVRRATPIEFAAYASAATKLDANRGLARDAVVWPEPSSAQFRELFALLPGFVVTVADKVTDVSGYKTGGKAIPL